MSDHTPGPWMFDGMDDFGDGDGLQPIVTSPSGLLASVFGSDDHNQDTDEARANARLIAAAPDLLASLKEIHDYVPAGCGSPMDDEDTLNIRAIARAAIAKAKGEVTVDE